MLSSAVLALGVASACSDTAAPRPQLVVFVDTDAHVSGELLTRDDLSADAAVDSLRVDVLDGSRATSSFIVSDPSSWPVSFGVVPGGSGAIRLRLRLFRSVFASAGSDQGATVLEPPPEVTIDRLVQLTLPSPGPSASSGDPSSGVAQVRVVLAADCLGTASSFLSPQKTCVDGGHPAEDPSSGVEPFAGAPAPTTVGTWASAVDVACASPARSDRVCIPGGFDILGDLSSVGLTTPRLDPVPFRPVVVSPFILDRLEFTVGRFRQLVGAGNYSGNMPLPQAPADPLHQYCTWLGMDVATNDALPLNCIDRASALSACQLAGGTLPTEAQWNHAARGRGQRRIFPWGNADPACCTESAGRGFLLGYPGVCGGGGVEPGGSHPPSRCDGVGDVSRDGVIDMAGSLTEAMLDVLQPYDGPCWTSAGILHDPACKDPNPTGFAAKGGDWFEGPGLTIVPLRYDYVAEVEYGFRCAYTPGSP